MRTGLIGKKIGTSSHFAENGKMTPITLIKIEECIVSEIKTKEKSKIERNSVLDGIPSHLPSLQRSQKLQKKAAKQGFDWDKIEDVFKKLEEEVLEFKKAVYSGNQEEIQNEIGDILFVLVNIARFKKIDAEEGLRATNEKFIRRFQHIEQQAVKSRREIKRIPLEELEKYWQESKKIKG